MSSTITRELADLKRMSVGELQNKYVEVFGEATTGRNKIWLQKRIAWRIQANQFGGLTNRAIERASQLANEADLRVTAPKESATKPKPKATSISAPHDDRLPPVGDYIVRVYKGQEYVVTVLQLGFEYEGQTYKTLSAIATEITGQHWNGFRFFNLTKPKVTR
ncbi:DUF2924 domain-containing protein [Novipirellula artificiosorum]|uniref:DUF2924 domain-containing protein n=1 Tax=Novipirellula artificiosorum TaxID=2528016 RepID=A0A5C6DRS1_9BACT|nr:DUF2924 domain-containing protein [Novipirellula artificiosorum]TWU39362.1 hypothetical protein Poly41_21860 [Novipirellula artificiosorum]